MNTTSAALRRFIAIAAIFCSLALLSLFNNCSQTSKLDGEISGSSRLPGTEDPPIQNPPSGGVTTPTQPDPPLSPSLFLDFNQSSLIAQIDGITRSGLLVFSRNSVASYFGSDGRVVLALTNAPRFAYDPSTCQNLGETIAAGCARKYLGLQLEEGSANWILDSSNFTSANWERGTTTTVSANAGLAPDGTMAAARIQMPNQDGSYLKQTGLQAGKTYTASIWVRANGQNEISLTSTSSLAGSTKSVQVFPIDNQWRRVSWTFQGQNAGTIEINNDGTANGLVDAYIWGMQVEESNSASSYIPTTTTRNVARPAERLTFSSDQSWFNEASGTWWVDWYGQSWGGSTFDQTLFTYSTIANDNLHKISRRAEDTSGHYMVKIPGQADTLTPQSSLNWSTTARRGSFGSWDALVLTVAESNGSQTLVRNNSLNSRPKGMNVLSIGGFNGYIRGFKFFKAVLPQNELNTLANSLK